MDDIFRTPTALERRLDASHKTGDDGGGTSFVFYDRPHGAPHHKEEEQKRKLYDPGPPVELHLSGATLKIPEGLEVKVAELVKQATEYEKKHSPKQKHIDITA